MSWLIIHIGNVPCVKKKVELVSARFSNGKLQRLSRISSGYKSLLTMYKQTFLVTFGPPILKKTNFCLSIARHPKNIRRTQKTDKLANKAIFLINYYFKY